MPDCCSMTNEPHLHAEGGAQGWATPAFDARLRSAAWRLDRAAPAPSIRVKARQVEQLLCFRSIFSSGHGSIATTGMKGQIKKDPADEEVGRIPNIKVELPTQESGCSQPVKRRRLQRHDVQVSQSMGAICKKEENKEAGLDLHNLWLKIKMEVKEEVKTEPADCKVKPESSFSTSASGKDGKNKAQAADGTAARVKAESVLEETGRQLALHSLADGKDLTDFEGQMTVWAHQCAEFRRKSTWTPSRPCCPASLFFNSLIVPEEGPPCVQRLSQKELCCLRRFFKRGHPIFAAPLAAADPITKRFASAVTTDAREDASFPASMKMWPWMRDLPSGLWAGRGLAYDKQNGLRRLSSAGGAEAMHDVQVWESVGAAGPPAAQPPTAAQSAAAKPGTVAVAAGDTRGNPSNAVKPARVLSKQQEKQSGVPGISWLAPQFSWQLKWTEKGKAGASARCYKRFSINSFMKEGLDEQRAEAAALEAAKHFRTDLVARGRIKEKVRDESRTSDVPGVEFEKGRKKWRVRVRKGGKRIEGGCFTEKSAAEACALELRELHGLQRTVKRCAAWAELPVIQPKVPFPGVGWHAPSQCWQGRTSGKSRKYCSFRPLDHSEAELEKAFAEAVAWLKKQQKEMQAREGAVAQIDKKGRSKKG
ncbi:unnamed protein product [Effrenium voratum]|nr:unnamed protein product [Effrenium voratum]